MLRRIRLVSSDNIEIAMNGLDSSFLDTLLTDQVDQVASINIPFTSNIVLEFVKSVNNPENEMNIGVANQLISLYKLLGIENVEVAMDDTNPIEVVDLRVTEQQAFIREAQYVIKIEIEQPSNSESESEQIHDIENTIDESVNNHLNLVTELAETELTRSQVSANDMFPHCSRIHVDSEVDVPMENSQVSINENTAVEVCTFERQDLVNVIEYPSRVLGVVASEEIYDSYGLNNQEDDVALEDSCSSSEAPSSPIVRIQLMPPEAEENLTLAESDTDSVIGNLLLQSFCQANKRLKLEFASKNIPRIKDLTRKKKRKKVQK